MNNPADRDPRQTPEPGAAPHASDSRHDVDADAGPATGLAPATGANAAQSDSLRQVVSRREKERFGGMKVGSAFFGWLTATGTAVLLTGVVAAAGTATGFGSNTDPNQAVTAGTLDLGTAGLLGAIVLLVVVFVSYFCGGYVAGRMARFSGLLQGLAVWLWALVIAIVAALVGLIWGANSNISENLNSFPRIPLTAGEFTLVSIVTALVVAAAGLAGALLGGAAGMRYHRRIDRAGLGD